MKRKSQGEPRLPAEWEPHDTWIIWPHNVKDWPCKFGPVPAIVAELVYHLHRQERVHIVCKDDDIQESAMKLCLFYHIDLDRLRFYIQDSDRSWARDSGPLFIRNDNNEIECVCFAFDGWSRYGNFGEDENMALFIARESDLKTTRVLRPDRKEPLVLEGGAIDSNGNGTLLVTEQCLLTGEQVRNEGMTREMYETTFRKYLGIRHVIWLGEGIEGDDTGGHVDDLCRFVNETTIVLAYEPDPEDPRHAPSRDNLRRLRRARGRVKHPLQIVRLPYPQRRFYGKDRQIVPASYANFYIARSEVLVPTFNDPMDREALRILARLFKGRRKVRGIYAGDFIWGLGAWHCFTQPQFHSA